MNSLAEQIIINILTAEMGLTADQIWIRDQNKVMPKDKKLYVIVGMVDSQPFSITRETYSVPAGMMEVQKVITRENIQIDILSRDTSAILRRYEILAALKSIYSQQQQELNSFKIYGLPMSFVNSSDAEGSSQLNRFSVVIPCHIWYRKEKLLTGYDYYNDFDTRVDDDKSIETPTGIIEFNITEDA
ncbi:hypothetical protein [Dyadobacter psychrotolerans]|uniref:DUF4255 domain-containing protein n=1 Tax=Dyadobacter psychrotolerans TaxID=2541721 RepID=A0A4R5E1L5_9BACT|nr:hypothetical protein [Dyadobacter psychrotolerans]TDE17713.1 hypothetical protein E0F88_07430 [Dyadobacter psychrotolerans]